MGITIMTKDQLLANLKPLVWAEIEQLIGYLTSETKIGLYKITENLYSDHELSIVIHCHHIPLSSGSKSFLKEFAQEHYNNMVLELFNLGEPQ